MTDEILERVPVRVTRVRRYGGDRVVVREVLDPVSGRGRVVVWLELATASVVVAEFGFGGSCDYYSTTVPAGRRWPAAVVDRRRVRLTALACACSVAAVAAGRVGEAHDLPAEVLEGFDREGVD